MQYFFQRILFLAAVGLTTCSVNDIYPENSTSTSYTSRHSPKNSSTVAVAVRTPDPFSVIDEANEVIFQATLKCPNGTCDDVKKCMRDINAPAFNTCAVLKSVYDCSYDGMLKCEGAREGVADIFANKFNADLKNEGCTDLFPVLNSASSATSTFKYYEPSFLVIYALALYFYFNDFNL